MPTATTSPFLAALRAKKPTARPFGSCGSWRGRCPGARPAPPSPAPPAPPGRCHPSGYRRSRCRRQPPPRASRCRRRRSSPRPGGLGTRPRAAPGPGMRRSSSGTLPPDSRCPRSPPLPGP